MKWIFWDDFQERMGRYVEVDNGSGFMTYTLPKFKQPFKEKFREGTMRFMVQRTQGVPLIINDVVD